MAGGRAFQAGKGLAGLDEHQVRRFTSWLRWVTLAMLAHAFLAVVRADEHANHPGPRGLVPLVRMLALRNLNWTRAAEVLYLMSGVDLSAATIGSVGRERREVDGELLAGLAVVLGVPVSVLGSLTDMPVEDTGPKPSPQTADVAELLWDIRGLTASQVRHLAATAVDLRSANE